jgi:signal transduction histidine kinase
MPIPITIVHSITAGIAICAGLSALFVALRKQQPVLQLTFAVMCFLIALNDVTQMMAYHSTEITVQAQLSKTQQTLSIMIGVMFLNFAAQYTNLRPTRLLTGLSIFGALLVLGVTVLPVGMLYSQITSVGGFAAPFGGAIFLPQTKPSPAALLYAIFPIAVFMFTIYACVQKHLAGYRRAARLLGTVAFIVTVTMMYDIIGGIFSVRMISLLEFGLVAMVLIIAVQFSDEIVVAESQLRDAQDKLELRVAEKTAELRHATVSLSHEVSVRKQAEESLQGRIRDLNVLNRISQTVTTVNDLPRALEMVCDSVIQLFSASGCYVFSPSSHLTQTASLQSFLKKHDMRAMLQRGVTPLDVPAIKQTTHLGEASIIEDAATDDRARNALGPLLTQHVHSFMIVPLKARGDVIGCVCVTNQTPGRRFSLSDLSLLENIAADIASALENARLYEQAKEAAVSIERQRLARELHDSVTQSLYSLTLLASGWGTMARNNKLADVPGSFRQLVEVGQQALREMRLLIHQLRPPIIEEAGIDGALRQRLEIVERRVDIKTQIRSEGNLDLLSLDMQEQLFQIAQEALNNALRHASATSVTIDIKVDHDVVRVLVEDDGVGFDPERVSTGVGTQTMRERARQIGGYVNVRSAINEGTTVEVIVHLNAQPAL